MNADRRRFLSLVGAIGAAGVVAPGTYVSATGSAVPAETLAALAGSLPRSVAAVRSAFDFPEAMVPMNAANLCPSPRAVAAAVSTCTDDIDRDCSFQNRAKFAESLEASRAAVARLLRVSPDTIALVRNTSEANNVVNNGIDLERGDEVVLWSENHPTNLVAWQVRAERFGLRLKVVDLPADPADADALIDPLIDAFSRRTRVLAISHVSNLSGLALPIATLTEAAHARGVHVHVDGAQSWGALDLDLAALGVDSFSASAHKWFMGPKEVGLLYVREEAIPRLWPNVVAPGWGDDTQPDVVGARKFESLGQRDDAALTALGLSAELHSGIGCDAVEAHMRALAQRLKNGLATAGARLVTPLAASFSAGVCVIDVPPAKRAELFDRLYREHGIIGAPTGGLRLCPHLYNTPDHVDRAVAGVKALSHLLG